MPDITRRRTGEMLRKLFEILMPTPDGMQARDALAELEKRLTLTEYEKGEYASGGRIMAASDPLATRPPRIKVQVKRQQQSVAVDGLRSFMALLSDDDVGIFVSVGGFTKDARDEARTQEKRRVTLIDSKALFQLWTEYYKKLTDEDRRRLPLKSVYFLAPEI